MTPHGNISGSFCRNVTSRLLKNLERVKGIEPSSSAWKTVAVQAFSTPIPNIDPQTAVLIAKGFSRRSERTFATITGGHAALT